MTVCASSNLHRLAILTRDGTFSSCEGTEVEWRHGLTTDGDLQRGIGLVCNACT